MPEVTIFHNPSCGTSRNTLGTKLEILPVPKLAPFTREDGEPVEDSGARRG